MRDTLHFGIISMLDYDTPEVRPLPDGFICDGDSFINWGDPSPDGVERDMTLHVSFVLPSAFDVGGLYLTRDAGLLRNIITDCRQRLTKALEGNERLADYVVITDTDDWSERNRIWLIDESISRIQ